MCVFWPVRQKLGAMNNTDPNLHPASRTGFRLHPGLLLEIYGSGPGPSATVKLSPHGALGLAQALIFDAREALHRPELTFNATEARHREALRRAELTFNATEARHQAETAAGKAL